MWTRPLYSERQVHLFSYPTAPNWFAFTSDTLVIGLLQPMPSPPTSSTNLPCKGCGFDLRAHQSGSRCPECGRTTYQDTITREASVDGGQGLLSFSVWLAAIPLSGVFVLAAFGGPLATLAVFGPIFHLLARWVFKRSTLYSLDEAAPWRRTPWIALLEGLLGCVLIAIMLLPIAPAVQFALWRVLAAVWVVLSACRLAAIDVAAASVLSLFGLSLSATAARCAAGVAMLAGLGGAASLSIFATHATGQPTLAFWASLLAVVIFGVLGVLSCWITSFLGVRVEGNLHYELVNQSIDAKEHARRINAGAAQNPRDEDLASIPLEDAD